MKSALITGGSGFLGRYVSRELHRKGFKVIAIGHGIVSPSFKEKWGIHEWHQKSINLESLKETGEDFDLIVHCAGSGSVGRSFEEPYIDFQRTVECTSSVLEFARLFSKSSRLIYPSSPAVQGIHDSSPFVETDICNPVSPYGTHKKMAEDLCTSYTKHFGIDIVVIRFFSIYGPWLKKQLIWDACNKIVSAEQKVEFWGTGNETRDWIHVEDAAGFIGFLGSMPDPPSIINGASGKSYTIRETLLLLRRVLGSSVEIEFNMSVRQGDPKFYLANMSRSKSLGWSPSISFEDGLSDYCSWFKSFRNV